MAISNTWKLLMNRRSTRLHTVILSFAFAILAITARSAEKDERECLRLHPKITSPEEMVSCTSDLQGSQDALNAAYDAVVRKISTALVGEVGADKLGELQKAEDTWLSFRNAQCEYEAGGYPGNTTNTSDVIACQAEMNRARAIQLQGDLKRWSQ